MRPDLAQFLGSRRLLIAIAAGNEWRALTAALHLDPTPPTPWTRIDLSPRCDAVLTGVGKANAAGGCARVLDPARHALVLSLGIAGTLADHPLGTVIAASACVFGDEGLATPLGFETIASRGFPIAESDTLTPDPGVVDLLSPAGTTRGPIACVSTCSAKNAVREALRARTNAVAEAMEGAAVALAAWRTGIPFAEVRVISNTTGDLETQRWDLPGSLATLGRVASTLC